MLTMNTSKNSYMKIAKTTVTLHLRLAGQLQSNPVFADLYLVKDLTQR